MPFQKWTEGLFYQRNRTTPLPTVSFKKKKFYLWKTDIVSEEITSHLQKRLRYQNEEYQIHNLDPSATKKAYLILFILQMKKEKKCVCYELTWKGLCRVGRWQTHWHTALLQSSCRGEGALLELEQFKKKTSTSELWTWAVQYQNSV